MERTRTSHGCSGNIAILRISTYRTEAKQVHRESEQEKYGEKWFEGGFQFF